MDIHSTPIYYYITGGETVHNLPNYMVSILPHSGEAITGIAVGAPDATYPNFIQARQYLGVSLTEPLIPGHPYRLSFWLANGNVLERYGTFMPGKGCDRFGALLSTAPPPQMPKDPFSHPYMGSINPQLEMDIGIFYHEEWRQYTFNFTPDSAYTYITFGNFYPDSLLTCAKFDSAQYISSFGLEYWYVDRAYYFIDDVVLEPNFHILTNDTIICSGNVATLIATGAYQGNYQWFTESDANVFSTDSNVAVSPAQNIRYIASDGYYSDTVLVEVRQSPQLNLGEDINLCPNEIRSIIPETSGVGTYLWNTGDTDAVLPISEAGDYWLRMSDTLCGSAADTLSVFILQAPPLPDWDEELQLCPGDSLRLDAASADLGNAYIYEWNDGSTKSGIGITQTGLYALSITDQCGQSETFEINITEEGCPPCRWILPTAFSPDENGLNDEFKPHHTDCNWRSYRLSVYSRWGEKVFETNEPTQMWRGINQKGRVCSVGVYVWTMEVINAYGKPELHRGYVSLLR